MATLHFQPEVDRILANAHRLATPALAVSLGLDIQAPQPEHEWAAMCPHCLEAEEKAIGHVEIVKRVSYDSARSAGDCPRCLYSGCDVLIALLPI